MPKHLSRGRDTVTGSGSSNTARRVDDSVFGIKIDYRRNSENPGRVFAAMSRLIDAAQTIDRDLAMALDLNIEPVLLLEDVQSSSLIAWLRSKIVARSHSDRVSENDASSVGRYLVRGKGAFMRYTNNRPGIRSREDVRELRNTLQDLAAQVPNAPQLVVSVIPETRIIANLDHLGQSMSLLDSDDQVTYLAPDGEVPVNNSFRVDEDAVERFLARDRIKNRNEMIMKIKKPDYLGSSRWEFRHEDRIIEAHVRDEKWLDRFHARHEIIRPGDCIHGEVETEVVYGFDGEVLKVKYDVVRVLEILQTDGWSQQELKF